MTAILAPDAWRRSPLRLVLYGFPAALLVVPAVAMQFTAEVQWTALDFIGAGVLLFGCAGLADLAMRKSGDWSYRMGAGLAVGISFLLFWINGAVGFIGDEDNPANLVYMVEIIAAVVGSVVAEFKARGMARAMYAVTFLQGAVMIGTLFAGLGADEPPGAAQLLALNGVFFALWMLAGGLFAKAARDANAQG